MAYVILLDNQLFRIAQNDNDKNEQNIFYPPAVATSITDSEFLKLKTNAATANVSDGNVTITDKDAPNSDSPSFTSIENLKEYHDLIKIPLKGFLNVSQNSSKSIYTIAQNYYNYLETLDYGTLTFPLIETWEKYCEDNSISYLHPLQIP